MKEKYISIFWGCVLVLAGAAWLILQPSHFTIRDPYLGMALNGGISLLFFLSYFLAGPKRWGWLFPACIFAGTTGTVALSLLPGPEGGWIAAPVLLSVAVPFLVTYFQSGQTRRWALIPAYIMAAITLVASFADRAPGELMGTLVLLAIALPFLVVYLTDRARRWALIPFGVLAGISIILLLTITLRSEFIGVGIMVLFTAAFGIVYAFSPRNWWALIPAGIFATLAVVLFLVLSALAGRPENDLLTQRVAGGVLFLGWALTFLGLWLRRAGAPTTWAVYPAVVLGVLALVTFIGGNRGLNYAWPLALIAGGLLMVFRRRTPTKE